MSEAVAQSFARFVDLSPTPYHSVAESVKKLSAAGFVKLSEHQPWKESVQKGGKYYFTRNGSTLVAFTCGGAFRPGNAFKIVGAHTDSPVLKVKPVSKREKNGYVQVGVETYGGGLWHTWLDRDLGVAGRVVVKHESKSAFKHRMFHLSKPILRVPSLCVHLQSGEERSALKINAEDQLVPILGSVNMELNKTQLSSELGDRAPPALLAVIGKSIGVDPARIVDLDVTLCDTQPCQIGGLANEYIFGPRFDNQMHCFTSIEALLAYCARPDNALKTDPDISMVCLFDHEEIGSDSVGGAGSPIMRDAVQRINECFQVLPGTEAFKIALDKSLLISADGAHAIHPNYAGKHETCHQPKLNAGTVIKTNANQRYATNGTTGFIVRELARRAGVKIQEFVVRQDSPCGSTIGPILSANTGIRTVDVGIPQLSMHSIRETCGVQDLESNIKLLQEFFYQGIAVDQSLSSSSSGSDSDDSHDMEMIGKD